MSFKEVTEEHVVLKKRTAKFSDFSGLEMSRNEWHWSAAVRCEIQFKDSAGNGAVHSLDGTPEEIADLKHRINEAIASVKAKYSARVKTT